MEQRQIQHLYWRAGFGMSPNELKKLEHKTRAEIVDDLLNSSRRTTLLTIDNSEFRNINPKYLLEDKVALRKFKERLKEKLIELNIAWIERLKTPKEVLREKMTLFWANHFVCQDNNSLYAERFNNTLREHALGNFRHFTKAVSKEAAMIRYLNLKQNRRQEPNENFARELMELFTLGNHNYSEEDIKQSARAFTGYNHDFFGAFQFRKMQHDYGRKKFFNRKGMFNGDDIIDIILLEKQCARFVCQKIYKYFVNEKLNNNHIDQMVAEFYPRYDIERVMRFVFMSNWFYDEANIGTKIKSPIEYLIGLQNVVPITYKNPRQLLGIQRMLGQVLFYPPNVAGWQGGKQWIDSNTILLRLRLASILLNNGLISSKEEGDFNDRFYHAIKNAKIKNRVFDVESDWTLFENKFSSVNVSELSAYIIQSKFSNGTNNLFNKLKKTSKRDVCVQLMSLPEYQMC